MLRGFRRILAYLAAERRTFAQGFAAQLIASMGSLIGGLALGSITGTLQRLPGLLVLIPAAVATRGNIFGALGSRLGTSIHAGLFSANREREGPLFQNLVGATFLTLSVSLLLAVLAKAMMAVFGIRSISLVDLIVISILGGVLASLFVGAFSVVLAIQAYRRGWDLDSVAAPLITASGDMFTVPALYVASFAVGFRWVTPSIAGIITLIALYATVRGVISDLPTTRRIVRESLPILVLAVVVDLLAGIGLQTQLNRFAAFPALLILVPPIIGNAGGLGGLLSARLASKIHLGVLSPRVRPDALAALDGTLVLLIAVAVYPLMAVAAELLALAVGIVSPGLIAMVEISILAGLMVTLLAIVVAYYGAVLTYRIGLDPDSHGIPMITSSMDFLGVFCVVLAILAVLG
jgi:mgtE-like transporter